MERLEPAGPAGPAGPSLSRREVLRAGGLGALALAAAACGGGKPGSGPTPPPGSIDFYRRGASTLSLLAGLGQSKADAIQTGRSVFVFDLSSGGGRIIEGGTPQVFVAQGQRSRAIGPFPATWEPFTGYRLTGDRSPRSPIPGVYSAAIDIPGAGIWNIAAVVQNGASRAVGTGAAYVSDRVVAAVGSRAVSVPTPVATTPKALAKVCTREPPCHMHYVSLDHAIRNGKPTAVVFSTPKFCTSRLCGPVTDEVTLALRKLGKARANFIHVEEFPTQDVSVQSPPFRAWGFSTEPWVVVIDRSGVIRGRLEGPATEPMIEAALRPLL